MRYLGYTYVKIVFVVYLKLKFNWASCMSSGNPVHSPSTGQGDWQSKPFS